MQKSNYTYDDRIREDEDEATMHSAQSSWDQAIVSKKVKGQW